MALARVSTQFKTAIYGEFLGRDPSRALWFVAYQTCSLSHALIHNYAIQLPIDLIYFLTPVLLSSMQECTNKRSYMDVQLKYNYSYTICMHTYTIIKQQLMQGYAHAKHTTDHCTKYIVK